LSGGEIRSDGDGSVEPIVPGEGESVSRGEKPGGIGVEGPYANEEVRRRLPRKDNDQNAEVNDNYFKTGNRRDTVREDVAKCDLRKDR